MIDYFVYCLEVSAVFGLLCLSYYFLLKKLSFHHLNRVILLLFIPVSLLLPACEWNIDIPTYQGNHLVAPTFSNTSPAKIEINNAKEEIPYVSIILCIIYLMGVLIVFSRLVKHLLQLFQIKKQAIPSINDGKVFLCKQTEDVFTAFHWIFVPESKKDLYSDAIICHEKTHAKLGHSYDLLVIALYQVFFWFNPFVILFQRMLKNVHEYQADMLTLKTSSSKLQYLQLLLESISSKPEINISSSFKSSTVKNRIEMITNNNSKLIKLLRYLVLIPVLALAIFAFTLNQGTTPSIFPIKEGLFYKITAQFGPDIHPILKVKRHHNGIDISAKSGTPIRATGSGKVIQASETFGGFGTLIIIDHGNGIQTKYAHMLSMNVEVNDYVKTGDIIGKVGSTGDSTGPHLHYEVVKDNTAVNPADFY